MLCYQKRHQADGACVCITFMSLSRLGKQYTLGKTLEASTTLNRTEISGMHAAWLFCTVSAAALCGTSQAVKIPQGELNVWNREVSCRAPNSHITAYLQPDNTCHLHMLSGRQEGFQSRAQWVLQMVFSQTSSIQALLSNSSSNIYVCMQLAVQSINGSSAASKIHLQHAWIT